MTKALIAPCLDSPVVLGNYLFCHHDVIAEAGRPQVPMAVADTQFLSNCGRESKGILMHPPSCRIPPFVSRCCFHPAVI